MDEPTFADKIRVIPTGMIAAGVVFILLVFGGMMKPWDAALSLLVNLGVSEEQFHLAAYWFGYTLPLSLGFFIIAYLYITGKHRGYEWYNVLLVGLVILWVCGTLSKIFGLGLAPTFTLVNAYKGPFLFWLFSIVWNGYMHTYGWPLVVVAFALGSGAAIGLERKQHEALNPENA